MAGAPLHSEKTPPRPSPQNWQLKFVLRGGSCSPKEGAPEASRPGGGGGCSQTSEEHISMGTSETSGEHTSMGTSTYIKQLSFDFLVSFLFHRKEIFSWERGNI